MEYVVERYRRILMNDDDVKKYKEVMEWVSGYYVGREYEEVMYEGGYAPLLSELCEYIEREVSKRKVLKECRYKVEGLKDYKERKEESKERIMPKGNEEIEYEWAYKRYLWEANIKIKK